MICLYITNFAKIYKLFNFGAHVKLLNEIIEALSSQDSSLTDALLKTKVLLHKIGHKELVEWVNNELNGYSTIDVPEYRMLPANILANMANMAYTAESHPIPLHHLDREQREWLENMPFNQSLAVLEKLLEDKDGHLQMQIPMEFNGLLGKGLANGFQIQRAWRIVGLADISKILVQVRSRLLDFMLELQSQLGDDVTDNEIKQRTDSIDASSLFNSAIFGNNTTIIVGSNNFQEVKNSIIKNDFDSLAKQLKHHNVDDSSITELQTAINNDQNSHEVQEQKLGSNVKDWMKRMLSKVVDGVWEIEIATAGNLLSTAIQKYYGW
jgi:hypothetical protein